MQHQDTARLVASVCNYAEFYELILAVKSIREWGRAYGWLNREADVLELVAKACEYGEYQTDNHAQHSAWILVANRIAYLGMYRMTSYPTPRRPWVLDKDAWPLIAATLAFIYIDDVRLDLTTTLFPHQRSLFTQFLFSHIQRASGFLIAPCDTVRYELSKLFILERKSDLLLSCNWWYTYMAKPYALRLAPYIREYGAREFGKRLYITSTPYPNWLMEVGLTPQMWVDIVKKSIHNTRIFGACDDGYMALRDLPEGRHRRRVENMVKRRLAGTFMRRGESTKGRYTKHPSRYYPSGK